MANDFKIKNGLQLGGAFVEKVGTISGNADVDLSTGNVFDYTPLRMLRLCSAMRVRLSIALC